MYPMLYLIVLYIFSSVRHPLCGLHLSEPEICQLLMDIFHLNFSHKLGLGSLRYLGLQYTNSWQVCSFSYHWKSV